MMKPTRMLLILMILLPSGVPAQVLELGGSLLATATAETPGCSDSEGGANATEAVASCAAQGYTAAGSAGASLTSSTSGGSASAFAEAAASSTGSSSNFTASGLGNGAAVVSWSMGSDTHYSVSISAAGGASASFSDGTSGPLPPSGVLPADIYQLRADAFASAQAQDINGAESVTDGPKEAFARVTFAVVGSSTLIRGTVLAGVVGRPGLLVEALIGETVVASALTGDDGSFLLPDLPGTVTLRISDPGDSFLTEVSNPLTPPATFITDLESAPIFADGFESGDTARWSNGVP